MPRLTVFNNVSLDGYFVDRKGDMSWAHRQDPEWNAFAAGNASGGGVLVFGRITYQMMASYWPTPLAAQQNPEVADHINRLPKVVFSRTLDKAAWSNTTLVRNDLAGEVRRLKSGSGPDLVILGSGTIVAQLTAERLIDEYQVVVCPVVLGAGRTMFEGLKQKLNLKRTAARTFSNGNVVLWYEPA